MKLHELKTGDRFHPAEGNKLPVYEVIGIVCHHNLRLCRLVHTMTEVAQECSMEVVKL